MSRIILILMGLFLFTPSFAEGNYFSVVNNFNFPLKISILPKLAEVKNLCGGDLQNIEVQPLSRSCAFEFASVQVNERSPFQNSGIIILSKKDEPASSCTYQYTYSYHPSTADLAERHSEDFSLQACQGSLKPTEISLINNHNQALARPLIKILKLTEYKEKVEKMTESIAQADCGGEGIDNCLLASPDIHTAYLENGSTLTQSLVLQLELDRYEPLNFAQFIGSHNAAISSHYTDSTMVYNLSHSDPDHYLTITDQLESGIRMLELDVQWHNQAVILCHDDVKRDPDGLFCEGNYPLKLAIAEIKAWVEKNRDAFLFIYFDVHAPLTGHAKDIDLVLRNLDPYIFTPKMAAQYYGTDNNTLPVYQLSKYDLIQKYKRNIIVTNDDDTTNMKKSHYVFVNVKDSPSAPLPEQGLDNFLSEKASSCLDTGKYEDIKKLFHRADPEHYNLFRLNEGRTVVNYVTMADESKTSQYLDYFTTANTRTLLRCPINIFSTSMLGYTCNGHDCDELRTDPKLYSFLWSWGLGYPLKQGGSSLAYLNPQTAHFENEPLSNPNDYSVLCYRKSSILKAPAPVEWYLEHITTSDLTKIADNAQTVCRLSGGSFAVPTTSYWMSDVINMIKSEKTLSRYVLVNYQYIKGEWLPNMSMEKMDPDEPLKGLPLAL